MVVVRLPNAGAAGHGAPVHGALLQAHPRREGRQGHPTPTAGRSFSLRSVTSTGNFNSIVHTNIINS